MIRKGQQQQQRNSMSPSSHRPTNLQRWVFLALVIMASSLLFLGLRTTHTTPTSTSSTSTTTILRASSWPQAPAQGVPRRRRETNRQLLQEQEDEELPPPSSSSSSRNDTESRILLREDRLLQLDDDDDEQQNTTTTIAIADDEPPQHFWYYNLQEPLEYTVAIRRRRGEEGDDKVETAAPPAVEEEEQQEWFHEAVTKVALDLLLFDNDEWNATTTTPVELFPVQLVGWQAYSSSSSTSSNGGDDTTTTTPTTTTNNSKCSATNLDWKCWTITQTLWIRQLAATTTTTKNTNDTTSIVLEEEQREWLDQAQDWENSLRSSIIRDVIVFENGGDGNSSSSRMSTLTDEFQQVVQSIVPPEIEIASILDDDSEPENNDQEEETETDSTPTDTTTTSVSSSPTIINGTTQDKLQDDDPTTTTTTDTKMMLPDDDGLPGWAIFLIGLLGAVSSCFMYGICFHKDHNYYHPKPKPTEIAIQVVADDDPTPVVVVARDDAPASPASSSSSPGKQQQRRRLSLSQRSQHSASHNGGGALSSPSRPKPKSILKKEELETGMYEDALAGRSPTRSLNSGSMESRHSSHHGIGAARRPQSIPKLSLEEGDDPTTSSGGNHNIVLTPRTKHKHSLAVDATGQVVSRRGISMVQASDRGLHVFEDTESTSSRGLARAVGVATSSSSRDVYSPSPPTANMDDSIVDPDDTSDDDSSYARQFKAPKKTKVVAKATPSPLSPEDDPYFSEGEYQTQPRVAAGANVVSPYASSQDEDDSVGEDDPELVYGGVYYGSDDDDDESDGDIERMYSLNTGGGLMEHTTIPPVYGGVYYGSDGEADEDQEDTPALVTPTKSSSTSNVLVNPPTMDYFTGIQPSRRTSNKKRRSSSSSRPKKYYNLSDPSVTSSLTNDSAEFQSVSSMLSVDEREWQRRNRQDWLHPVNEDEHDYHHSHGHGQS